LLVLRRLPETHAAALRQSIHPRAVGGNYLAALRHARFLALVFTFCFVFNGLFINIAGSPAIIFDHLGLDANHFGVQFVPMVAGLMAGAWLASRLSAWLDPERVISLAFLLAGLGAVLNLAQAAWLAPAVLSAIGPLVLYAFAVAMMMPNLSVMALDCFPRNRGVASAMQSFLQVGNSALVAGLAVPLVAPSLLRFALAQTAFLLLALATWWWSHSLASAGPAGAGG